jgi:integrase
LLVLLPFLTTTSYPGWAMAKVRVKGLNRYKSAGTWGAAVSGYKAASDYITLAPRTQSDYEKMLDYLEGLSDLPLSGFDAPRVNKIKEKCFADHGRRKANYVVTVMSIIFNYAILHGLLQGANPASTVKPVRKPKSAPEANVPWSEKEIHVFMEHARPNIGAPFAVAMFLGMRGGDVLRLKREAYQDGVLRVKTSKTGIWMPYPVPEGLRRILDQIQHNGEFLFLNSRGIPWTENGYRHVVFELRNKLAEQGLLRKELTLHGLRTTVGQIAAELGYSDDQIADGLGQKDTKTTKGYVRDAGRTKNVKRIILDIAENRSEIDLHKDLHKPELDALKKSAK